MDRRAEQLPERMATRCYRPIREGQSAPKTPYQSDASAFVASTSRFNLMYENVKGEQDSKGTMHKVKRMISVLRSRASAKPQNSAEDVSARPWRGLTRTSIGFNKRTGPDGQPRPQAQNPVKFSVIPHTGLPHSDCAQSICSTRA